MNESSRDKEVALAAYYAYLEEGQLVMEPYCTCGSALDENYYCERCEKHCRCTDVVCEDQATLNLVEKYIRTSPKFRHFNATIGKRKGAER